MKKIFLALICTAFISGNFYAQEIDINQIPKQSASAEINLQKPRTFVLENGLTVMIIENHKLPTALAYLTVDNPPISEGKKVGKFGLLSSLMGKETQTMSKEKFADEIDFLGSSLEFGESSATMNSLSRYFPETLSMFASALITPKFTQSELEQEKSIAIENLRSGAKDASEIAKRVSKVLIYGKNSPYGEVPTIASVQSVQLADIQDAYLQNYTPNRAYLSIVGDVNFEEVKSLVEKNFSAWKKGADLANNFVKSANPSVTEIDIVNVPSAVQTVIRVGNLYDLKMNSPEYFPVSISNYVLGGGALTSRLNQNLREKNGFTYGASSNANFDRYNAAFSAGASVGNDVIAKAIQEAIHEINAIKTITPEELNRTKSVMKGEYVMAMENPAIPAMFASNIKMENLPENFYADYLKNIDKISLDDVQNSTGKYLRPENLRIIVVGNTTNQLPEIKKLGYPVKFFDTQGNPITAQKPAAKKVVKKK